MMTCLDEAIALYPPSGLAEFLEQPETEPASDWIDSKIIQKPMPQGEHSVLQEELSSAINQAAKPSKIARAFPELRCTFGDNSIVPDIAVFRWARIPTTSAGKIANRFLIHPDWAIEILSSGQSFVEVLQKLLHCIQAGTELGWLIYPKEEQILAVFPGQRIQIYKDQANLPILGGIPLTLTVRQVFNWLML